MNLEQRIHQVRTVRRRIWRRQLLWAGCWAVFCALWQPVLFNLWSIYHEPFGWWMLVPLWILAGSPALTFFWFYHGRLSRQRILEMALLYGPISSILMGWIFWSTFALGHWLVLKS